MKRFSDFQNLTSQELAANESFQAYVRGDKDEIVFWETFISMYPEKRTDVAEAAEILNLISFRQNATPSGFKESELNRLLLTVRQEATDTDIVMHGKSEPFAGKTRSMLYTLAGYGPSR